ncbi:hypothetical protein [Amycolatopsis sp. H20-H5]|uniref:hypothetical protein n=1 Tax=Amycolatopsis sp. H20-H5 TaxID=3046309 RepID=UPI002DBD96FF|nr:hypothetical protein [Amycolatopsis sp. H20-H5]MEC3976033.1 hypothetical protein [Amycolatopsis sp. H20-H5]
MNPVTRAGALLAALTLLTVLTGCGVRPTGVVQAGEAPVGVATGPMLYFLGEGNVTTAAPRVTGRLGTVADALTLLFAGQDPEELASGLNTALPPVTPVLEQPDADVMIVRVPLNTVFLSRPALDQIACTAIAARVMAGAGAGLRVTVFGKNGLAAEDVACSLMKS